MRKRFVLLVGFILFFANFRAHSNTNHCVVQCKQHEPKLSIKIKNDTNDEVLVNTSAGGTYSLTPNVVTIIKMEAGAELYLYEKGRRGRKLLTATVNIDGKLQLLSKL